MKISEVALETATSEAGGMTEFRRVGRFLPKNQQLAGHFRDKNKRLLHDSRLFPRCRSRSLMSHGAGGQPGAALTSRRSLKGSGANRFSGFADVCHILNPHKDWGAAKTQIAKKQL